MKKLSYNDVVLIPEYSSVKSRSECDTKVDFLGVTFESPVIPANMRASIDIDKALELESAGYFYILHRFYDYEEIKGFVKTCNESNRICSISLGVKQEDYDFVDWIEDSPYIVDFITIDVAHAHNVLVKEFLSYIKSKFKNYYYSRPKLIVGNVATRKACEDLMKWGADAVKAGIGQGTVCTTRLETGFGVPMYSTILDCAGFWRLWPGRNKIPIIADGGINHRGDVAKAINAGADMVMVGSMFARCIDSPAENIYASEFNICSSATPTHKRWYGSASEYNKGHDNHGEGEALLEPVNYLSYLGLYRKWKQALQSAISYGGGTKLKDLRKVNRELIK